MTGGENGCAERQLFPDTNHCVTEDKQSGLGLTARFDPSFGTLAVRASYGEMNEARFDLDRRRQAAPAGMTQENMLATIGIDASLADGAITLKSDFGVNRRSYVPTTQSALTPARIEASSGTSQNHALAIQLLDAPAASLALDAGYSRSTGLYLPFATSLEYRIFTMPGEEISLGAKARFGDISLKAKSRFQSNDRSERTRHDLAADYRGLAVRARHDQFTTAPALNGLVADARSSNSMSVGIDLTPILLFPELAFDLDGWAALLPTTASIDFSQRQRRIDRAAGPEQTDLAQIAFMALWTTPLGDTLVSFDRESGKDGKDAQSRMLNQTVLIDHGVRIDGWSIGANIMLSTTRGGAEDDTMMIFYGLSAKRRFENGIDLRLDIGRDSLDLDTFGGAFTLRDKATTLRLSADMSNYIRTRFRREDLSLRLEGRLEFGRSGYEVRFDDAVLDRGEQQLLGHGILLTVGARLP